MSTNGDPGFLITSPDDERGSPHSMTDSALGGSTSPDTNRKGSNSQCSSMSDREENFICYGEGTIIDFDTSTREVSDRNPDTLLSPEELFNGRNTWLRTSLRRSPASSKVVGSNALASHLYRSSSFNSSGRSSNCDNNEDMYSNSDVSIEEDVIDLNRKVKMLEQQVDRLANHQVTSDDKYTRAKQDNGALTARAHMLEEQLREAEMRGEERLLEEQRRNKELFARVEREKLLEVENYNIKLQNLEKDYQTLQDELSRSRLQMERLRNERAITEDKYGEAEAVLVTLREDHRKLQELSRKEKDEFSQERRVNQQLVEELTRELELNRRSFENASLHKIDHSSTELPSRIQELEMELRATKEENRNLHEANGELQAEVMNLSLKEGQKLPPVNPDSLHAELEAMSRDEVDHLSSDEVEKIKVALREQKEVNTQLRAYIDGILLNIVENYPQLLEVKNKKV